MNSEMNNCFFELPQLKLPITTEELFDEVDILMTKGFFEEADKKSDKTRGVLSDVGTISTNCVWYKNVNTHSYIFYEKPAFRIAQIHNKKIQKLIHQYMHDTIHEDYIGPVVSNVIGMKILPVDITAFYPVTSNNWHNEGPRAGLTEFAKSRRKPACINFHLIGPKEIGDTSVKFCNVSDKFQAELDRITKLVEITEDISTTTFKPENHKENTIHVAPGNDTMINEHAWKDDITEIAERHGHLQPYCINVGKWHKVVNITSNEARCSLRFLANTKYSFEHYEKLHYEGKFIKTKIF